MTTLFVLIAYSANYAVTSLLLRDDAMMIKFTPRWVRLDQVEVTPKGHTGASSGDCSPEANEKEDSYFRTSPLPSTNTGYGNGTEMGMYRRHEERPLPDEGNSASLLAYSSTSDEVRVSQSQSPTRPSHGRQPTHRLAFQREFRISRWYSLHRRRLQQTQQQD